MKKKILLFAGIILAFLVLSYGFVPQVLAGKIVNQSDISGHVGMSREASVYNAQHPDEPTYWTGSMFSGMPTVSFQASTKGDWTQKIYDVLLAGKRPATYLFVSLLGAFLLLLSLGISPLVAAGGAVAVTFCAYNIQIIQVGHNTKMQALAFLPWVLAAVIFTYRRIGTRRWLPGTVLGASLFALALSLQIKANHPQISYYLAMMILLYAIAELVSIIACKQRRALLGRFFAASGLLLVLGGVGIATNATKLLPTWEYTDFSIRGGSASTGEKGVDLGYATAWSYGWEELPNLLIPNYNGGSSAGAINPSKSETCRLLKKAGQKNIREISKSLPFYWGPQPFTAGPMYMGAITVFLFILGLFLCGKKEKWWIIACTVLAVLLAVGNHFMGFTKLFYEYAPLYAKFRTVSMALVILQFTLPILAFLALDTVLKSNDSAAVRKTVFKAGGITMGMILLLTLLQVVFGSFSGASDAGQPDILVDALSSDRKALLLRDSLRSLLFCAAAACIIIWPLSVPSSARQTFATHPEAAFARRRTGVLLVCLIIVADLFPIGKRYLGADDFVTPKTFKGQFAMRPADKMILEDKDPSYRVLDLSVNVFNDSHPSYWHKNIGGYSPAKLRIYQDYIENHLTGEINSIYRALKGVATVSEAQDALPDLPCLSLLNCRYIIIDGEAPPIVNHGARGNAWFENGSEGDGIVLTSYAPNELRYSYSAASCVKAVFSEVYYPAGWTAELEDGTPLDLGLSDEVLRCAVLPAGKHEVIMRFAPVSYRRGEAISRASSILLILLVLLSSAGAFFSGRR